MLADADIQVWLDTQLNARQALIVPYVQSGSKARLQYQINLVQRTGGGTSRVSQQGDVVLSAGEPASLSRLAVGAAQKGSCELEVVLRDRDAEVGRFSFDCAARR